MPYRTVPLARIALLAFILATATRGNAQLYPAAESYIGFTLNNNEYGVDRQNSPGFQFSFSYNPIRHLRLVGDFAGQYHSTDIVWSNKQVTNHDYQFLFGPELAIRNRSRTTPFFHAMIGVATRHYAVPSGSWTCTGYPIPTCYEDHFDLVGEWGLATAFGGGLDLAVHPNLSVRVVQFDFLRTHLSSDNPALSPQQGQFPVISGWQNNYRFGGGIVFRLGERGMPR